MLLCEDVPASVAFYVDVLGFAVREKLDDVGRSGWASLARGSVRVMLSSPAYIPAAPKVEGRFTQCIHYFYVDDVAALREAVLAAGAVASDLAVRFYGRVRGGGPKRPCAAVRAGDQRSANAGVSAWGACARRRIGWWAATASWAGAIRLRRLA